MLLHQCCPARFIHSHTLFSCTVLHHHHRHHHAAAFLYLSSLGLGTYLGLQDEATDEAVLAAILYSASRGWNVIDTGRRAC